MQGQKHEKVKKIVSLYLCHLPIAQGDTTQCQELSLVQLETRKREGGLQELGKEGAFPNSFYEHYPDTKARTVLKKEKKIRGQ